MIFLVLLGKMVFLFPENAILPLVRKMNDDLSHKKYMKMLHFLRMFSKDGLFEKIALE